MLGSSRKSFRTQTTERTQSGRPHCQSFGPAVWIHKEAPGNGFLMDSSQDQWADRKCVKYLLFWLRLELWPYLKSGPNEGHFGGDYSLAALHEVRLGIKASRWSAWVSEKVSAFEQKQSEGVKADRGDVKRKRHKISPENRAAWRAPPLRCLTSYTQGLCRQTTLTWRDPALNNMTCSTQTVDCSMQLKTFKSDNF